MKNRAGWATARLLLLMLLLLHLSGTGGQGGGGGRGSSVARPGGRNGSAGGHAAARRRRLPPTRLHLLTPLYSTHARREAPSAEYPAAHEYSPLLDTIQHVGRSVRLTVFGDVRVATHGVVDWLAESWDQTVGRIERLSPHKYPWLRRAHIVHDIDMDMGASATPSGRWLPKLAMYATLIKGLSPLLFAEHTAGASHVGWIDLDIWVGSSFVRAMEYMTYKGHKTWGDVSYGPCNVFKRTFYHEELAPLVRDWLERRPGLVLHSFDEWGGWAGRYNDSMTYFLKEVLHYKIRQARTDWVRYPPPHVDDWCMTKKNDYCGACCHHFLAKLPHRTNGSAMYCTLSRVGDRVELDVRAGTVQPWGGAGDFGGALRGPHRPARGDSEPAAWCHFLQAKKDGAGWDQPELARAQRNGWNVSVAWPWPRVRDGVTAGTDTTRVKVTVHAPGMSPAV